MEADISQIKMLLWVILGLQALFVLAGIVGRFVTRPDATPDYTGMLAKRDYDAVLEHTQHRLQTHPGDVNAMYFRAIALQRLGKVESVKVLFQQIGDIDPRLGQICKTWIDALDPSAQPRSSHNA